MKKVFLASLLVVAFLQNAKAQEKGDVEFGLSIGFNSSTVSSPDESAESSAGLNLAASADYYFSDRWSIKGKLIYDQKGWDNGFIYDLDSGNTYATDYDLNYVTVPVMANWHFAKKRNWYLNFGPYLGFLSNAEETRFNTDVKEFFNATDFGLAYGIGVKIPVSDKLRIFIEYDGQSGFTDVFKDNYDENILNSRSSFNVGLNFKM